MTISIVTVTRDCVRTLPLTLASVAGQTYSHREHILIDGASLDGTLEVVGQHRGQLDTVVSETDLGIYDALNKGISHATGDVIALLHGDDVYPHRDVLARVAEAFRDPAVEVAYGDLNYVGAERPDHIVRHWVSGSFTRAKLRRGWAPPHPALFLRRSVYERLGRFDLGLPISSDYDFMLRVFSSLEGDVVYLPEVLVHMRWGGTSTRSIGQILRGSREDWSVIRRHRLGRFWGLSTLAMKSLSKVPQFLRKGPSTQRKGPPAETGSPVRTSPSTAA